MKKKDEHITIIERFQNGGLTAYSVDGGESYHPTVDMALADQIIKQKEKKIRDMVQIYLEHLIPLIAEARSKVIKAGASPNVMYIGDIFLPKKGELPLSPIKLDTGCKVFGMKIIADYRVPFDKFYIMQGEL